MLSKFDAEDMRKLCAMISDPKKDKAIRSRMLQEAFVWQYAPKGKYFWRSQKNRLDHGKDITGEARDALKSFNSVKKLTRVQRVDNLRWLLREFKLWPKRK